MTTASPLGILDSGIGGLSVWKEVTRLLPLENTVYIADSAYAPYGRYSEEKIFRLSVRLVQFLLNQDVKLIVIACNTITVSCVERLRKTFPTVEFVGTVPALRTAHSQTRSKIIGVLATERTAKSDYLHNLIKKIADDCTVLSIGTNKLVPLIEEGEWGTLEEVLPDVLSPFLDQQVDVLVLGCTHYPLIRTQIEKVMGKSVVVLDSGEAIARRAKSLLEAKDLLATKKNGDDRFYTTGDHKKCNVILEKVIVSG